MKRTIHYIGFLFLMCCANIAMALESPEKSNIQAEVKPDKEINPVEPEYNFTLFKFLSIKPEVKKEELNPSVKPISSPKKKTKE